MELTRNPHVADAIRALGPAPAGGNLGHSPTCPPYSTGDYCSCALDSWHTTLNTIGSHVYCTHGPDQMLQSCAALRRSGK